ncbi:MAG: M20 peptidase family dipeptidase, partial [Pseudomonadota bacterium]
GNWGGLLRDPAIVLSNAIASICDEQGRILVEGWRRDSLTDSVRAALAGLPVAMDEGPSIDPDWGEPGLSAAERVLGWNSFAVLSLHSGVPEAPQNAIAPSATAVCQLRIVVGTLAHEVVPTLREHLDGLGFHHVQVSEVSKPPFEATRVDPTNPWVDFAQKSIEQTTGKAVHILPNLGGSLPNAIFASLPTIWIPHSYRGCSQHAPDEHVLEDISRESVRLMAGLYYDVGSGGAPPKR